MKNSTRPSRQYRRAKPAERDSSRAVDLVMRLMSLPGPSGKEGPVVRFLAEQLTRAGIPSAQLVIDGAHRKSPFQGETGNLIVKLPGTFRAPRRLFSAHLDTVPLCVGCRPRINGRRVNPADPKTGLGADDRAGCAVLLDTLLEITARDLPHPPLTFCWFVQEEVGLMGSRHVSKSLLGAPRAGFNFDGGVAAKLTIGATSGYRLNVEVNGLASHAGGAPEQGVSAIAIAALAIADLHRSGWHGDIRKAGNRGTSNVGVISGGEATNVVTDRVLVRAEARSHNPEFRDCIVAEIERCFRRAAESVSNVAGDRGVVSISGRLDYEAFLLSSDVAAVRLAETAVLAIGRRPERAITNGGLDANWLVRHGIPTVSLGCGQKDQHMRSESLDLDEFGDACRIAHQLATMKEF